MNQKPVSVEGRLGPVGPNLAQGAVPLEFGAEAFGQLKLQLKGSVDNLLVAPAANVSVEVAEFSAPKLMAEMGQPLPATADAQALERVAFKAVVKADAKAVTVSDGVLSLDDSRLNFPLKASVFAKPRITFDLKLDQIDLDRYLLPKVQKTPGGSSATPASPTPPLASSKTDYTPLRQLVMDGSAKIGKLSVSHVNVENVTTLSQER